MNVHEFIAAHNPPPPVFMLTCDIKLPVFYFVQGVQPRSEGEALLLKGTKLHRHGYSNYGTAHSMSLAKPGRGQRCLFYVVPYSAMERCEEDAQ